MTITELPGATAIGMSLIAGAMVLDALVRPRPQMGLHAAQGLWLLTCMTLAVFGLVLTICGNPVVALALTLAVQALLAVASNAKHAMLGEPLLFSDLALIGAIFHHPQFYLSAVAVWQRVVAACIAAVLLAVLAWLWVADLPMHLLGAAIATGALGALAASLAGGRLTRLAPQPDARRDTARLGLYPALLVYWLRWRASADPAPCAAARRAAPDQVPHLVIAIQCESFADPEQLFADVAGPGADLMLPELDRAREAAIRHGGLQVSGFGAYTMRTEYGVVFGRDEEALGFRRYDPFLTALGEASYALPARLAAEGRGWRSLFVHPHDMRFYGRDRIMPAAGFDALVGEDAFAPPAPGEGRYVTDAAITAKLLDLAAAATGPTFLYAVTIENHGPWAPHGDASLMDGYMQLVRKGDTMLGALRTGIAALRRPALLVFFGDHRPSIPGVTRPGPDRNTPYVMLRFDADGRIVPGTGAAQDMTPAELHHAILDEVLGPRTA